MKNILYKRIFNVFYSLLLIISLSVLSLICYYDYTLSENYSVTSGQKLTLTNQNCITVQYPEAVESGVSAYSGITNKTVSLDLFGVFPVKSANVQTVDESYVYLIGKPFGIKLFTNGVLVVSLNEVKTEKGGVCPAKAAGLKVGDSIISVDGQAVKNNEQLSEIIEQSAGREIDIIAERAGKKFRVSLQPVLSADSKTYKAGIWIRDSSAGIGTLTFYSPTLNVIAGLGHGICDSDTDQLLSLGDGELVNAEILSVERSVVGAPGELVGRFRLGSLGKLVLNSDCGVYGLCDNMPFETGKVIQVANKHEVVDGDAIIVSTIDGNEPKSYKCKIKIKNANSSDKIQNMIVTVTDDELLNTTGGIVQGMSGSPIIQNGKLIGAVTHVLIDSPNKGYGIFAENMLDTAQSVAQEKLKDAS